MLMLQIIKHKMLMILLRGVPLCKGHNRFRDKQNFSLSYYETLRMRIYPSSGASVPIKTRRDILTHRDIPKMTLRACIVDQMFSNDIRGHIRNFVLIDIAHK